MSSLLVTLREQSPQLDPAAFLQRQRWCWILYFDDSAARDPAKMLAVPRFNPRVAARKQREGCGVGFSLQGFWRSLSREDFLSYRSLGANIDVVPAAERWSLPVAEIDRRKEEYLTRHLDTFPLKPHWLIETRHGFHAVFRILPVRDPAKVRDAMVLHHRLVRAVKGEETAVSITQILRLPGMCQLTDPDRPFPCRLLRNHAGVLHPYSLVAVRGVLDAWELCQAQHPDPAGATGSQRGGKRRRPFRQIWMRGIPAEWRESAAHHLIGTILARLPEESWELAGWGALLEWNSRHPAPFAEPALRRMFEAIKQLARQERAGREKRLTPDRSRAPDESGAPQPHAAPPEQSPGDSDFTSPCPK
jgi:hypothetical protein